MKAVFLTKNKNSCENVYTPETRARLAEKLEFLEPVYTTEALAARENELRDVEIIFSTWGMFSLTSEEIARYFPNLRAVFYGAGSVQYFAPPIHRSRNQGVQRVGGKRRFRSPNTRWRR